MVSRRTFLFLQGPHGRFFKRLGQALAADGHRVIRVNFNAGDWLDWHGELTRIYRGRQANWPDWVRRLAEREGVSDLVVYGDCRPMHKAAKRILEPLGVSVHVFEEGYLRPDWITYERGGANANSPFANQSNSLLTHAVDATSKPHAAVGAVTRQMIKACLRYYAALLLGRPLFPRYRTHRPLAPAIEMFIWAYRLARLRGQRRRAGETAARLLAERRPFFLLPLQLDSDCQISHHSDFNNMAEVIETVMTSFAAHAPADATLVVKNHPLDNGRTGFEALIGRLQARHGLAGRVVYLDGGALVPLLRHALGVVVVNSTSGLQAVHHGVPTKVLGRAIYDLPGITARQPLDRFWTECEPVDEACYEQLRKALLATSQINGCFYNDDGIDLLLAALLNRDMLLAPDFAALRTAAE